MIVYLNGEYLPQEEAKISPNDRGFLFGEGIYEAIPFYCGKPFALDLHQRRLERGLDFLSLHVDIVEQAATKHPGTSNEHSIPLLQVCRDLLSRNAMDQMPRTMIYLQITRGSFPTRTHTFSPSSNFVRPTIYAFAQPIEFPNRERWRRGFSAALVPDRRWGRVDIKTIQLLPNVLAYQDAKENQGVDDAILVKDGVAIEGAHQNFWAVVPVRNHNRRNRPESSSELSSSQSSHLQQQQSYVIVTHPDNTHAILPGVTRAIVLEEARRAGMLVEERPISVEELRDEATEAFFTSTTSEVRPSVQIDGRQVGHGTAGPITQQLHQLFLDRVERDTGVSLQQL